MAEQPRDRQAPTEEYKADRVSLTAASKTDTDWPFLLELRDFGRRAAEGWLSTSLESVGRKSTADIPAILSRLTSPGAPARPSPVSRRR